MKVLFAVISLLGVTHAFLYVPATFHTECQRINRVNQNTIDTFLKGEFGNDSDLKCYIHCVLNKINLYDDNRDFKSSRFVNRIYGLDQNTNEGPNEEYNQLLSVANQCAEKLKDETSNCVKAFEIVKCLHPSNNPLIKEF